LDELTAYAATSGNPSQANFGFGIDSDCHYYNSNLVFQVTTQHAAPEPASMTLLGLGLLGIWKFGKKRSRNV